MGNRKIAFLIFGVYALSLIASVITVQPAQAAVGAGYWENGYSTGGADDEVFTANSNDDSNIPYIDASYTILPLKQAWPESVLRAAAVYMVDMNATKTSSAGGVVNPGSTITYTVKVNNTGGSTQNDLIITDPLPAGTTYVPQSTKVSYTGAPLVRTYRDEFSVASYNNSNGTTNWSAYDWIETGVDKSGFPDSGTTSIFGGRLRFNGTTLPSNLTRSVPMAGAISATLSFDYLRFGDSYGGGDVLGIEVINGSTITRLDTFDGNLAATGTYSRDITAYARAGTEIQFVVSGFMSGETTIYERLEIDNVQVQYTLPGTTTNKDNIPGGAVADLVSGVPPTMVSAGDNIDLPAGSTLTMTYQVRVDKPAAAGLTNIVNTAEVRSAENPNPLQATTSDRLRGVHLAALKTAAPATVPETGGSVTFMYTVANDGMDPVTIDTLVDDRFGPLVGDADCKVGTTLAAGASCSFEAVFLVPAGEAGGTHVNNFTVTGSDGFGNTGTTAEGETVTYSNVLPDIRVLKTASLPTVSETGGSMTFTYTVTNNSSEAATITSLSDDQFGPLQGDADCQVGTVLPGNTACSFSVSFNIPAGNTGGTHVNVFTAAVRDNEGSTDTAGESETVTYTDVEPQISVLKTASDNEIAETGGDVTFTYTVHNESPEPVTITELNDDVFGPLSGDTGCAVGIILAPDASCSFDVAFTLAAADVGDTHTNVFTASARDDELNLAVDTDDATVTYEDALPEIRVTKTADQNSLPETGGNVVFTFLVENTGQEAVTLTSLIDDVYGDLSGQGTCAVPQTIAVGRSYSCQYTAALTSDSLADHVNTVTAEAEDNDGSTTTSSDSETITFTDVQPAVAITKTANPTSVPETGGSVTFTFLVENTGQEAATLTSLVDDVFGDLNGQGTCSVPQTIPMGGSYTCSITETLTGDTTANHANTVTAVFGDNDGNTSTTSDGAVVSFTNAAPEITVLKTAGVSEVAETGGSVKFTYTITNGGVEPVTIGSLSDDPFGVLSGDADCQVGTVLAGGAWCAFDATFTLPASDWGETHTNTFTAVASDNEGGSDTATDDEKVTYIDVEPRISVLKTASDSEIEETGGDVTFTYTVTNLSAEPAMITLLWDDPFGKLLGDADCNNETTLGGGASCSFKATFAIPAGEPGGTHVDTFTASVIDDEENSANASENETVTYTNVLPDVTVTKTAAVSTVVETGENVTFTFTVRNNSREAAEITALTDDQFGPLAGGADCQVGTVLAGGASCSFNAVLAIPAGAVGSTHVNAFTAVVEDNEGSSDSASESETITYTAVPAPAITVLKEVFAGGSWWDANTAPGPEIRYTQNVSFRFTVRNTGNVTLTGITLTDSDYSTNSCILPASLSPNDGVDGSGTDQISCIIITPWVLGQHTNTATASASYGATPVSANDVANYVGVNNAADLAVTKTDGVPTYTPGGQLIYTIVVTNNGPDPVTGAVFTDAIPAQIAHWTWACAHAGGASGCADATNSTDIFTNTINLPVGSSVTYTVNATTRSSATTNLTNTARISTPAGTDDPNPGNNNASDVDTAAPRVDISLNKAVDAQFRAGENLSYTLTVTNNGPSDAANVVLSDVLPNEVTFVSANPATASGPNPVTWNLGTLASGATRTIQLVVRVKDWINQPFTNTASVTSTTPESSATDNSDTAVADPEEPTPVTLLYFRAAPAGGLNVLVEWKAETEVDHVAYKLYRSTTPVFADAEERTVVGSNPEKTYSYIDTVPTAGNYYYWLVDISTTNAVILHEPVLVILNAMRFYLPLVGR